MFLEDEGPIPLIIKLILTHTPITKFTIHPPPYLLRGFQLGIWTPLVPLIQVGQLTLAELNAPFNIRSQL